MVSRLNRASGFTLLEMAIVLVIVGILLGGGIPMVKALVEQNRLVQDRTAVAAARQALVGYALSHGGLPVAEEGVLPAVLGVATVDGFGRSLGYAVNPEITADATGGDLQRFCEKVGSLVRGGTERAPRICNAGDCAEPGAVAFVVVATGPDRRPNGENAGGAVFENPSRTFAADYDDVVRSYALTQLYADCRSGV